MKPLRKVKTKTKRKVGFYWVNIEGQWEPAYYDPCARYKRWMVLGSALLLSNNDFEEIGEAIRR